MRFVMASIILGQVSISRFTGTSNFLKISKQCIGKQKPYFNSQRMFLRVSPLVRTLVSDATTNSEDVTEDDGYFRFPPLNGNILVIGDGDFSYSGALVNENQSRGSAAITASSLDTKEDVEEKYSRGKENLTLLDLDLNVSVMHG